MSSDLELLARHRSAWEAKPFLRESYARYHDMILRQCPGDAVVLEVGAGLGHLAEEARARGRERWLTTDVIAGGRTGLLCDAAALPLRRESVDRVVFVDVLHHMAEPRRFLAETARVLRPGGLVVAVEPWITPFSYPIYRWVHEEGCDLSRGTDAPFARGKPAYEGDAGLATLVCRRSRGWEELGLSRPLVRPFNDFAYLTTRGLRPGRDAPAPAFALARLLFDRLLAPLAPVLGLRALIRWNKTDGPRR